MKYNERIKRWMHLCWEWCWVELFPTTPFFPWCTAMHWNGGASLYWLVKNLQSSSQSSWPWCKVKFMRVRHKERVRQFQDTHLEKISDFHGSSGHIIKTQPCIPVWMSLCTHLYLCTDYGRKTSAMFTSVITRVWNVAIITVSQMPWFTM